MLKLRPSNVTVPDQFRFICPEDGIEIKANDKNGWFEKIKTHYQNNGYALPENWKEIAEDQVCRTLSGEWCEGGKPASFINTTRFSMVDFGRGTKVLGSFILSGDSVVDEKIAESRALICSRCFANVSVPGCSRCHKMANVVAEAKGAKKTKYDHLLKSCGICHCSNEAAVWLPIEHIRKGVTDEMLAQFDEIEDCWRKSEIAELKEAV